MRKPSFGTWCRSRRLNRCSGDPWKRRPGSALNNLAWLYATSAPPYFKPKAALDLALQAVAIGPDPPSSTRWQRLITLAGRRSPEDHSPGAVQGAEEPRLFSESGTKIRGGSERRAGGQSERLGGKLRDSLQLSGTVLLFGNPAFPLPGWEGTARVKQCRSRCRQTWTRVDS